MQKLFKFIKSVNDLSKEIEESKKPQVNFKQFKEKIHTLLPEPLHDFYYDMFTLMKDEGFLQGSEVTLEDMKVLKRFDVKTKSELLKSHPIDLDEVDTNDEDAVSDAIHDYLIYCAEASGEEIEHEGETYYLVYRFKKGKR